MPKWLMLPMLLVLLPLLWQELRLRLLVCLGTEMASFLLLWFG